VLVKDCQRYQGEPVLTLQEALDFARSHHWAVNIEIKNHQGLPGHRSVVERVVAQIEASGLTDQVLISSFNQVYLKQVKAVNPHLATGALVSRPGPDPLTLLRRLDAQAYHPKGAIIQPQTISSLREHGFDINVWTVNDEATMRHFIEVGASGLFTDFPQRLKALLAGA
jgi:glycerophosphoryl diester phosphodiesterase